MKKSIMPKLLSIIIPTYNMEALLDQCLTSLVLSTKELRGKLDVIVVIDGAKDRSSEIAHRYADEYPETFSVIDKENGNYGSCINAALPMVKGKYVRILDADDSYYTENMPEYLKVLEEQNVDLVLTDFNTVDTDGVIISDSVKIVAPENNVISLTDVMCGDFIPMHSVAYRSSIFKEIDYYQTEGISYTDLEWVFHPMAQVRKVYYHNKLIYRYLIGRDGQTVDAAVRLKRLSDMEKGLWTQLKVYSSIPKDNPSYPYLTSVVNYRTELLYTWGLDRNAIFDLKAFDAKLKADFPEIYEVASSFTLPVGICNWQMPIVKMWRRVKSRNGLLLFPVYDLSVIISKLK